MFEVRRILEPAAAGIAAGRATDADIAHLEALLDQVDATTPVAVTVPGLTPANGSPTGTLIASISPARPGHFDQGRLIVSHNGAVVASASLDGAPVATGQDVKVPGLPGGTSYYLSVIVWNSKEVNAQNPGFTYQSVATPVTLSGDSAQATVTIN